jgi:signal transduction histidine kinase
LVGRDPEAATALLGDLKGEVKSTITDIRRLVYALRPPVLDEFGLLSAIKEYAAQYEGQHAGSPLHIVVDAAEHLPPLPAAVEVAAYRIVLEALTNVVRHARAQRCTIRLDLRADALHLEVVDDGVGIPDGLRAGVGIASMRERAAELGGMCIIEPIEPHGTRVWAQLPLGNLTQRRKEA